MLARASETRYRAQLDTAHLRHTARTRSGATNTRTPIPDDSARPRRRRIGALLLVVVAVVVLGASPVLLTVKVKELLLAVAAVCGKFWLCKSTLSAAGAKPVPVRLACAVPPRS